MVLTTIIASMPKGRGHWCSRWVFTQITPNQSLIIAHLVLDIVVGEVLFLFHSSTIWEGGELGRWSGAFEPTYATLHWVWYGTSIYEPPWVHSSLNLKWNGWREWWWAHVETEQRLRRRVFGFFRDGTYTIGEKPKRLHSYFTLSAFPMWKTWCACKERGRQITRKIKIIIK